MDMKITLDQDWLALVAYKRTLEEIVHRALIDAHDFTIDDAAALAKFALESFPDRDGE